MAIVPRRGLEPERLLHAVRVHGISPERLAESWRELVTRVVGGDSRGRPAAQAVA